MSTDKEQEKIKKDIKNEETLLFYNKGDYSILLNKYLLVHFNSNQELIECKVVDFSPSGEYVKLNSNNDFTWHKIDDVNIHEILNENHSSELNMRIDTTISIRYIVDFKIVFRAGRFSGKLIKNFSSESEIKYLHWYINNIRINKDSYKYQAAIEKINEFKD